MKRKTVLSCLLFTLLLSSCGSKNYEIIDTSVSNIKISDNNVVMPFNTVVSLRNFSQYDYNKTFQIFEDKIHELHKLFDRYNEYKDKDGNTINNLKVLNQSYGNGKEIVYDNDLIELVSLSIELAKLTEGYFNPTLGILIDEWSTYEVDGKEYSRFTPYCSEALDIDQESLKHGLDNIIPYDELEDYLIVNKEKSTIEFKKYKDKHIVLSLGAIAKGYAIEQSKLLLEEYNISAMIDGGSSSSYGLNKNPNPDRDYWLIGLSSPYKNILSTPSIATLKFEDTYTLSVSGDYEQCFYFYDENGNKVLRHHILNPYTGYPENYQRVVSVKSSSRSDILDALSTAIFSIESIDKINDIVSNVESFYNIDIDFFIEREIDSTNKKIDIYLDEGYKNYVQEYNSKYFNQEFILKEGENSNEENN